MCDLVDAISLQPQLRHLPATLVQFIHQLCPQRTDDPRIGALAEDRLEVGAGAGGEHIAERKCADIAATGADAVVLGDLGCMLNIEGRLRRRGDDRTRVLHVAEVLAGKT